jgi:hypothetical protein
MPVEIETASAPIQSRPMRRVTRRVLRTGAFMEAE